MAGSVLVNGEAHVGVAADDRGLCYGDGLFETVALRRGNPLLWGAHLERLSAGAALLGLPSPDAAVWSADLSRLLPPEPAERLVLKLMLTRGSGGRGYAPPPNPAPTRILQLFEWPDWPDSNARTGIAAHVCATRLGCNPTLAGLKHLNRLEQVLAAREVGEAGVDEGLMLDGEGRLVEGVRTNLFMVVDGELLTPTLRRCGVRGVMRDCVLEGARELRVPFRETDCDPAWLARATEIFVCNSLIGLWPVRSIAGLRTQLAAPGDLTRQLQAWLGAKNLTA